MASRSQVTALPPTITIQDPATRAFLDALVNAWDTRSGVTNDRSPERFITAGEFNSLAGQAIAGALSGGVIGGAGGGVTDGVTDGSGAGAAAVHSLIDSLAASIRDSVVHQLLGTQIQPIDLSAVRQRTEAVAQDLIDTARELEDGITAINTVTLDSDSAAARDLAAVKVTTGGNSASILAINDVATTSASASARALAGVIAQSDGNDAAIVQLNKVDADTTSAAALALHLLRAQVNDATTGLPRSHARIALEETARTAKDTALANSIKTIWAAVGGSEAAVQEGVMVDANNVAAVATKFTQIEAAVRDPNTGIPSSTSIKQDLNTYANNATGALSATYGVRLQTQSGGTTVSSAATAVAPAGTSTLTLASGSGISAGMRAIGAGIPTGAGVTAVSGHLVTLSTPLTTASATGSASVSVLAATVSGALNAAGNNRLVLAAPSDLAKAGMAVSGIGIPAGTIVTFVADRTTLWLSDALTANASGVYSLQSTYTFTDRRPLVGGFAMSASNGVGTGSVPSIDIGFRGDRFFIGATADTPDAATQIAAGTAMPFMVLTTAQTVNGKVYPPGVYMKKAVIGEATIGTAQIADLSVDTLKIAGAAVTVPITAQRRTVVNGTGMSNWQVVARAYIKLDVEGVVYAQCISSQEYGQGLREWNMYMTIDGIPSQAIGGQVVTVAPTVALSRPCAAGVHEVTVYWAGQDAGVHISSTELFVMGAKR